MPATYRIDAEKRRVFTSMDGVLTYREATSLIAKMGADPLFNPAYTELSDLREVTSVEMTMDQIAELAALRVFARTSRRAIVATNPLYFGMARMYESHHEASSGGNVRVFSEMAEALLWIDSGARPDTP
ncbi:MAG TPA: hypothetical protein VIJ19_09165 [Opitutaceae bacterium]